MAALQETTQDNRSPSLAAKAGVFIWHWVQLVLAMEAGMILYHLLTGKVLAGTGFAALTMDSRLFGLGMTIVFISLGAIALLRIRRSAWQFWRCFCSKLRRWQRLRRQNFHAPRHPSLWLIRARGRSRTATYKHVSWLVMTPRMSDPRKLGLRDSSAAWCFVGRYPSDHGAVAQPEVRS